MITFQYLNTNDKEMIEKLQTFAADFGNYPGHEKHTVTNFLYPIYIVKDGEEWIGYFQTVTCPVIFSAWHPKYQGGMNARRVMEAMFMIWGWCRLQFGNGMCAVKIGIGTFTPIFMQKLGFRKMGLELYEPENK